MGLTGSPTGELAALGAAALWAVSTILWTRQMKVSSPESMNLFKTALCAPLFWIILAGSGSVPALPRIGPAAIAILIASGVIGMSIGDTAYFAALPRIGARRTMMIQCLTPLFAAGLSLLWRQEIPRALGGTGVILVIAGLVLVLRERPEGTILEGKTGSGLLYAHVAAFCQALGIVLTKIGIERAGIMQVSAIRILAGVLGILLLETIRGRLRATVGGALKAPALRRIVPAALMGSFVAFFLFQVAIRYANPSVAAALTGTSPLFIAPLSIVFLGESMRAGGWIGTALAVAGVMVLVLA